MAPDFCHSATLCCMFERKVQAVGIMWHVASRAPRLETSLQSQSFEYWKLPMALSSHCHDCTSATRAPTKLSAKHTYDRESTDTYPKQSRIIPYGSHVHVENVVPLHAQRGCGGEEIIVSSCLDDWMMTTTTVWKFSDQKNHDKWYWYFLII